MEKKKISVITVIFIVLIVVAIVGMLCYIILLSNEKKEIEGKVENLNTQIADLNNSIANLDNEKSESIEEEFKLPILDSSKVINVEHSQEYEVKHIGTLRAYGLCFEWDKGEVSVSLDPSNNMIDNYISVGRISDESELGIGKDKIKVKRLSKKVSNVKLFTIGNGMGYEFIVFLMEDGTCEYAKFNNFIKTAQVDGKVEGLKNIVILESTDEYTLYNGAYQGGGGHGAVAIDKDGNAYDLDKIINKI